VGLTTIKPQYSIRISDIAPSVKRFSYFVLVSEIISYAAVSNSGTVSSVANYIIIIIIIFRPLVLHSWGALEIMNERKTRTRCVSADYVALPSQNAARIGETHGIKVS